jgi:hypothetical protein
MNSLILASLCLFLSLFLLIKGMEDTNAYSNKGPKGKFMACIAIVVGGSLFIPSAVVALTVGCFWIYLK